ncbi:phytanoyl-CoA dioxygenase family protein [Kribbella sp. NBC_01245]|uniref:phytanoyl-CoA dioxygenase family protein n=1 Tax=Kribbella sp. NBC_01245 TaxID=2903578 RepID=UPI002E28189F|nr:phytanoyl-CoA dioxygenase family protein [Kribbella sp. NBC_01245]
MNPNDFDENGYAIYREVIDADLIKEVNGHVEWLQRRHPDVRPEQLGHTYLRDDPFWVRLVSDPRLLRIAEAYVGPDIALFASHYISKPPYSGQPVLWHQDAAFWPLDPMRVVTWLAVDHSTPENGCVRLVPGSHRHGIAAMRDNTSPHRRCGLTIRYIPTSTRITDPEEPFPSAFHLQGSPGVNQYQPRPSYVEGRHYPYDGASA